MAIGEDDPAALVDDEAGCGAGAGGLGVEGAASGGAEDDDGGDDFVECFPPVLGGGDVFSERRIDFHEEVTGGVLDGGVDGGFQTIRSQPLHWISHSIIITARYYSFFFFSFGFSG